MSCWNEAWNPSRCAVLIQANMKHLRPDSIDHTLITWPLASEWTLICHTIMPTNTINFLYNPGHVTLWCLEVVLVVYARASIDLLFLGSSCTLIIKKKLGKIWETEKNFHVIYCSVFLFFFFLFLPTLWNGPGKDLRNNTSMMSGLNNNTDNRYWQSYNMS